MTAPARVSAPAFSPAVFLALGAGLTGLSAAKLGASDLSGRFTDRFHSAVAADLPPALLDRLADVFLSAQTVAEGAAEVLVDPELSPVGRAILRLWHTGLWQAPSPRSPARAVGGPDYLRSSIWRDLQSHAPEDPRQCPLIEAG